MKMYTIFDQIAEFCAPPFVAENDNMAKRMVMSLVNDSRNINDIATYPQNFDLKKIGEFNADTGEINKCPVITICNVITLKHNLENTIIAGQKTVEDLKKQFQPEEKTNEQS